MKFSEDFVLGGATAAYQCEGSTRAYGKGKVAWDDYLKKQGKFTADPASDFYHKYPEDLKMCEQFHIRGIRISIAWSRIFPEGKGEINKEGVDFYHRVFKECHKRHVEPYVTLHHFDTPAALHEKGDFLNRDTIDAYVEYARFCFEEYKDEVTYWFTFNEVWPISTNQYIEGTFPPCIRFDVPSAIRSMHGIMVAHAKAVTAFKEGNYQGKIGVIHAIETKYPYDPENEGDYLAAKRDDILANQFLLDATFLGRYSKQTMDVINDLIHLYGSEFTVDPADEKIQIEAAKHLDFLGVNYYASNFLKADDGGDSVLIHNGSGQKGSKRFKLKGIGERVLKEGIPTTDWDWLIYPEGMYDTLLRIKDQYPNYKAIYITENGMGYKDDFEDGMIFDEPRIDYIQKHLQWLFKAIEAGVNVKGYFLWSLQDMFSWSNGYNKRYGLFYVDYKTQKRYPKASAYWYKRLIDTREIETVDGR